jgi:PatG Domain
VDQQFSSVDDRSQVSFPPLDGSLREDVSHEPIPLDGSSPRLRPPANQPYSMISEDQGPLVQESDARVSPSYVYAIGHIEAQFPSLAVEREFAQVVSRYDTSGLTDQQVLHLVLSERENRYLVRQMCWIFSIQHLPTYVVVPRDPGDLELLVNAIRTTATEDDLEVLIGVLGPIAPPEACGGVTLPMVAFDQLYSFGRDDLLNGIPRPDGITKEEKVAFKGIAGELFDRFMQITDNTGSTKEHRALNYLAVRYPAVYFRSLDASLEEKVLSGVEVRSSRLSATQDILDVIFSYTHRRTDVTEQYFVRVDATGEFPYVFTKLQAFYER